MKNNAEQKAVVMNIAMNIFAEKGFESTTTRDIANASNINIATLHYYFQTKEKLYTEVLEFALTPLLEEFYQQMNHIKIDSHTSKQEILQYIKKIWLFYVNIFLDSKNHCACSIILYEALHKGSCVAQIHKFTRNFYNFFDKCIVKLSVNRNNHLFLCDFLINSPILSVLKVSDCSSSDVLEYKNNMIRIFDAIFLNFLL